MTDADTRAAMRESPHTGFLITKAGAFTPRAVEDLVAEVTALREALHGCIPWVAANPRGAAQEALAVACDLLGVDPYDWSAAHDTLTARRRLLGMPDRRAAVPAPEEGAEQ